MTKYPNSSCEVHRNVETSEPICMGHNETALHKKITNLEAETALLANERDCAQARVAELEAERDDLQAEVNRLQNTYEPQDEHDK